MLYDDFDITCISKIVQVIFPLRTPIRLAVFYPLKQVY